MKVHDIEERAFRFACRVAELKKRLSRNERVTPRTLNQLTASSSSIGANLEEARGAQGPADFHAKIRIALKEAREAKYWLRYVENTSGLAAGRFAAIVKEAGEIVAILTTIARKANPKG